MRGYPAPIRAVVAGISRRGVRFRRALVLACLLGCGGSGASDSVAPPGGGSTPAAIAITPSTPAVALGSQIALQATVQDPAGDVVPGATVFWSSEDTTVVVVSSTGVVTGVAVGTAEVAASSGGQSAVVPVAVVPIPVASVSVVPSTATVAVGGTVALQAVAYDDGGRSLTGRSVVWATNSSQIATVNGSGTVTGVKAGSATITATSEGKTGSATVAVTLIPVAAVTISPGSASLKVDQSASLAAVATDANGNVLGGRTITWSSANSSIAKVSDVGLVTAVGAGTTTVKATSEGKSSMAQIVVTAATAPPPPVATVSVTPSNANLVKGGTVTLSATLRDADGNSLSGRNITWASSAAGVAKVSGAGVVTAVSAGSATITATSEGKKDTAVITVAPDAPPAPVASVHVSPSALTLRRNEDRTLTATVNDAQGNALTGRTVTWTSSNNDAVSVTQTGALTATVRARRRGILLTVITATCDGVDGASLITILN